MAQRVALLVAVGAYNDPLLRVLRAPAQDVGALAEVLRDPDIGGFTEVRTVVDGARHEIEEAIEDTFAARKPGDVALVYFTCHGVKDLHGRLYFAAANTRSDRLASTAISSVFVNEQMERSRASAKVALLDCCFSGAFARGLTPKGPPTGDLASQICGRGSYVITATNSLEYAYEEPTVVAPGAVSSSFTALLVEGLRSGAADWDRDGEVSPEDLYWYLDTELRAAGKPQTPTSFSSGVQGRVSLASAPVRLGGNHVRGPQETGRDSAARQEIDRHLRDLEVRYSSIREVLPSGGRRTALLDDIPAEAAALAGRAQRLGLLAPRVAAFRHADDAARVVTLALCTRAETPTMQVAEVIADGITHSRSAFEQYWALRAATALLSELPPPGRHLIRATAEEMLRSGAAGSDGNRTIEARWILDNTDVDA